MNDQEGNPISVPLTQAPGYLSSGYTQPNQAQLTSLLNQNTYSQPGQEAKAALEGAASAATFGASTAAEVATGLTTPEAIQARRGSESWMLPTMY